MRNYYLDVTTGKYWAIELRSQEKDEEPWIPHQRVGPIAPEELARPIDQLDFSQAESAADMNIARMVLVDDAERHRLSSGRQRITRRKAASGRVEMPGAPVIARANLRKTKADAEVALRAASTASDDPAA